MTIRAEFPPYIFLRILSEAASCAQKRRANCFAKSIARQSHYFLRYSNITTTTKKEANRNQYKSTNHEQTTSPSKKQSDKSMNSTEICLQHILQKKLFLVKNDNKKTTTEGNKDLILKFSHNEGNS